MYIITQGNETLDVSNYIEYVKLQDNGKKVTSTQDDYDFIYSSHSDKFYDKDIVYVNEVSTLEDAQAAKLMLFSSSCDTNIDNGADVTISDDPEVIEHFTYNIKDQANISEMFMACLMGASSYPYHKDDGSCRSYSAGEVMKIYSVLSLHKTEQLTYFNQLKQYVKSLTSADDVLNVEYGQELTGEFLMNYQARMQEAQTQLQAVIAKVVTNAGTEAAG